MIQKWTLLFFLLMTGTQLSYAQDQQYATWIRQSGGAYTDQISDMVVAADGSIYTLGVVHGSAVFGSQVLIATTGTYDVYVTKSDANGNVLWVRGFGDIAGKLALGPQGSVYVSGSFTGTDDFGNFSMTSTNGGYDYFVLRLESNGNVSWVQQFVGNVGNQYNITSCIASDAAGNVYVGGSYRGSLVFGPTTLSTPDLGDIFLAKLNAGGTVVWAETYGGTGIQSMYAIDVDAAGNIYTAGTFETTITLSTTSFNSFGSDDIVFFKTDNLGEVLWARQFGGSASNVIRAIATDDQGNSYVTGNSDGITQFGTFVFSSAASNVFVCKISNAGTTQWMKNYSDQEGGYSGSDIFVDNSGNSYVTGSFNHTINFDAQTSCNIVNYQGFPEIDASAYVVKNDPSGNVIWAKDLNGIYDPTGVSVRTFGSVITADASGNAILGGTFIGNLTEPNVSIQTAESLSGPENFDCYVTKLTNCAVIPGVTQNGNTLTATASGANYQWIKCNAQVPVIAGATSQSYTPTTVGNYSVYITQGGCTVSSDCITISTLGIDEIQPFLLAIYPNPNSGNFTVETEIELSVTITNAEGKLISTQKLSAGQSMIDLEAVKSGVYFVSAVNSYGQTSVQRISIIR